MIGHHRRHAVRVHALFTHRLTPSLSGDVRGDERCITNCIPCLSVRQSNLSSSEITMRMEKEIPCLKASITKIEFLLFASLFVTNQLYLM